MKIYPIVEGYGEVEAVPVLLRRLRDQAAAFHIEIARPHRRNRSELTNTNSLRNAVEIVLKNEDCGAIIVIFDADDDCPKEIAPDLEKILEDRCGSMPSGVVMANREFEAWFLANTQMVVDSGIVFSGEPEIPRDAKGKIEECMGARQFYDERTDQPRFAAKMDLAAAFKSCRSFRKLTSVFGSILETGPYEGTWPPAEWTVDV